MVEATAADEIELRVVTDRLLDLAGDAELLEGDQVIAFEEADEIGGAGDERPVEFLHEPTLPADRVTSPVTAWAEATRDSHRFRPRPPRSNALGDGPRTVVTEFNRIPNKGDRALHHRDRVRRARVLRRESRQAGLRLRQVSRAHFQSSGSSMTIRMTAPLPRTAL